MSRYLCGVESRKFHCGQDFTTNANAVCSGRNFRKHSPICQSFPRFFIVRIILANIPVSSSQVPDRRFSKNYQTEKLLVPLPLPTHYAAQCWNLVLRGSGDLLIPWPSKLLRANDCTRTEVYEALALWYGRHYYWFDKCDSQTLAKVLLGLKKWTAIRWLLSG